ncbi:hypothetical protein BaRGS_00026889 [Batillaria attramentaria]|uniref:Uncharacterized protein n=1 Tax=Batillaria attramentaria TaxID=370345 RepID=A0ABD0K467_9CAEN
MSAFEYKTVRRIQDLTHTHAATNPRPSHAQAIRDACLASRHFPRATEPSTIPTADPPEHDDMAPNEDGRFYASHDSRY